MFDRKSPVRARAAALALAFHAASVLAGGVRFDIPAQPLAGALKTLATQAEVQLMFAPEAIGAARSAALNGELDVETALRRILAGSGLEFRREGPGRYIVVRRAVPSRTAAAETELAPMTVTATRTERQITDVPASVSVISAKDMARQQPLKTEDVLKNLEGIDFNAIPGNGGASTPMIRGIGGSFTGATSSVLVDGLATDSSISGVLGRGGFNFLAPQDIERMEVVRGPASALYGPNVVGGVVNLIAKRWRGAAGAEINAGYGSHNSRAFGAAAGAANERFDVRLSVYDFHTDGFIAKPDPDPDGNKDSRRRDWQDRKWSLSGGFYPTDDQEIRFAFQQFHTQQGYAPSFDEELSHWVKGNASTLGYRKQFSDQADFKLNYRYTDLLQSWGPLDKSRTSYRKSQSHTVDGQLDWHPVPNNTLTIGASWQSADYSYAYPSTAPATRSSVESFGVFIQDEHRFGNLVATLGGRYDRIEQDKTERNGLALHRGGTNTTFNPRGGLRYHFTPETSMYASVGTAFVPANADLKYMGEATSRFINNPGLKPEKSISYELGVNHRIANTALRAAIYHTDYQDMISGMSVGKTNWPRKFVNIGRAAVNGLELGIQADLYGGWKPYANYSYTASVIKKSPDDPMSEGKQLQRIAPHKFNFGLVYDPGNHWQASFMGRYVDKRYFTGYEENNRSAAAYFVADLKISARLPVPANRGRWEASLAINNLFDKKYVVWEYEYADRRTVWAGLNAKF